MNNEEYNNLSLSEDDDIFYPGQFDADIDNSLTHLYESFLQIKEESEKESKQNLHRFIISTTISVFALIASVVAAVAAVIPLL